MAAPKFICRFALQAMLLFCTLTATAVAQEEEALIGTTSSDILNSYIFRGRREKDFRKQLFENSENKIQSVANVVQLSPEEDQKLRLAAEGDVQRFLRDLEDLAEKTKDIKITNGAEIQKIFPMMAPLIARIDEGLHGDGSLFAAVLNNTLSPEKKETYSQHLREEQNRVFLVIVKATVADLEDCVPMTSSQRSDLMKILSSSKLPSKVARSYMPIVGGLMLAEVSDEELNGIFDKAQKSAIDQYRQRYAGLKGAVQW